MLTILSLDALSTMCFGTCNGLFVKLTTSLSDDTFGHTSIIAFPGITCSCLTTAPIVSKKINRFSLHTTLTFPMSFAFSQFNLATYSSGFDLVAVTISDVASKAFAVLAFTSAPAIFRASVETSLEIRITTFLNVVVCRG